MTSSLANDNGPRLRIGMFSPYSLTIPGGVQAQVFGLVREMRRRGHEARVLGACDGPPPESFVTPLGNSLPLAANGSIAPIAPDPAATLRTFHALRGESFDVIHLHEPLVPGPVMAALLVHSAPTVATFHAAGVSASYRLMRRPLSRMINRIDHKVVVSKDALALVQAELGGEYEVLFNGVELAEIGAVDPFLDGRDGLPTVFFCARHEERKGLQVLLDALSHFDVEARIWIAGDGPETEALQKRAGNDPRVEWLGRVSDEEKFARLRSADVFCAPSLGGESFGVVLIEAMAAGTTVVASALDGYRNVATHGLDALLVPPGDPVALADALKKAMLDEDLAVALRLAGSERAERFAMSSLASRYVDIYRDVIASRMSS